jgi:hypothetical protein
MDMALSPGLLLLLVLGLGTLIGILSRNRRGISTGKAAAILILCAGIWLATDLALAQGGLYGLVKSFPILRSLHANVRFGAAFIFPLALLGAFVFQRWFEDKKFGKSLAFLGLGFLTLAMLGSYMAIPKDMHVRSFNLRSALPIYPKIDSGWNFTLKNVAEITDMQVFVEQDSNLSSQDPMFGYQGESFNPKAVAGPILGLKVGTFNMTNPAGYVFPEENHLQPFDLFREDQKADLELFINHQQPKFEISTWQKLADVVSLAAFVLSVLYLFYFSIKAGMRVWQMNAR